MSDGERIGETGRVIRSTGAGPTLAALVAGHPMGAHPAGRIEKARLHLADTLGNALAACHAPIARVARAAAPEIAGSGECSVLGVAGGTSSPAAAAFANGVAAHCLEYDDTHLEAVIHPSVVVVPAVLAMAEVTGATVGQALDAIVLGWEVACRLGLALGPPLDARGFHVTGILGPRLFDMVLEIDGAAPAARLAREVDAALLPADVAAGGSRPARAAGVRAR